MMVKATKIKSRYAILDVEKGRINLNRRLKQGPVTVVIYGSIDEAYGGYDGVSQEFSVNVTNVEVSDAQIPQETRDR